MSQVFEICAGAAAVVLGISVALFRARLVPAGMQVYSYQVRTMQSLNDERSEPVLPRERNMRWAILCFGLMVAVIGPLGDFGAIVQTQLGVSWFFGIVAAILVVGFTAIGLIIFFLSRPPAK